MDVRILVVGGGVIGLSSAYELARRGAQVTVLERDKTGAESSWAGGGILFPLLPWDYEAPVTALTECSRALFPVWLKEAQVRSGIDPQFQMSGMRILPPVDLGKAEVWCHKHNLACQVQGDSLWLPEVAQVRNPRLMQALRKCVENLGVRVIEQTEVRGVKYSAGRVEALQTSQGEVAADSYVVAAGAWSSKVLGELAPPTPIWPVRGQMLLFQAEPGSLPHILLQQGTYLIPRLDGLILVGSTLEEVGFDKNVTDEARDRLWSKALQMFPPLHNARLVRHWAGLRPGSKGNVPVIGRHPEIDNLYLNSGHFRYGVTMAPASAELLANMLEERNQPLDVAPYAWN